VAIRRFIVTALSSLLLAPLALWGQCSTPAIAQSAQTSDDLVKNIYGVLTPTQQAQFKASMRAQLGSRQ
jgi:hypothetical protein